ncbi:hypothetical protein [Peptoniphilus mikwangii]|uniref:hypothetical protein n=1 Tax=Peptoniphilus mikwangii TaxID=1354300 RepID=UPI0004163228|nr:hypothetical protein [Peptoniphilus mikwangii]
MFKKYIKIILLIIVFVLLVFLFLTKSSLFSNKDIVFDRSVNVTDSASDFHISTNGLMIFDGKTMYICDKNANLIKSVSSKNRELKVFFANNYGFLYDEDVKKLYEYNETGELVNTLKLDEYLYNISYKNKNIILHFKGDNQESLKILKSDGKLYDLYSTSNYILAYDVYGSGAYYAIAEFKIEATGHQNIVTIVKNGNKKVNSYSSEITLFLSQSKNRTVMVTDKKMYIFLKDNKQSIEIPNISDILIADRNIYLLHSNIISKYNLNLKEKSKTILAANVDRLEKVSNSIYAYGDSDIGGDLGKAGQFYKRLGTSVDKIEISGIKIGTMKDGKISLYKVINSRNFNKNDAEAGI